MKGRQLVSRFSLVLVAGALLAGAPGRALAATPDAPLTPVVETFEVPALDLWMLSPDGSLVAGVHGDPRAPDTWCLHELPSGTERWCIDAAPGDEPLLLGPAWLPDGSGFLLSEYPAEGSGLWRIDAATGAATDLTAADLANSAPDPSASQATSAPSRPTDLWPAVSPDGTRVAFVRLAEMEAMTRSVTIQLMPTSGGAPSQVVQLSQTPFDAPVWSHDGRWLHGVELGDHGGGSLWSVAPDGAVSRSVELKAAGAEWLPDQIRGTLADGRLLIDGSCSGFGECRAWLVDPVTGRAELLVGESADEPGLVLLSVAASPDGLAIAALVRRDGVWAVELIDPDTRTVRSIPLPDLRLTLGSRVRWLTDGRIVVSGDPDHPRRYLAITLPPGW